jgi:hypothetical protein
MLDFQLPSPCLVVTLPLTLLAFSEFVLRIDTTNIVKGRRSSSLSESSFSMKRRVPASDDDDDSGF